MYPQKPHIMDINPNISRAIIMGLPSVHTTTIENIIQEIDNEIELGNTSKIFKYIRHIYHNKISPNFNTLAFIHALLCHDPDNQDLCLTLINEFYNLTHVRTWYQIYAHTAYIKNAHHLTPPIHTLCVERLIKNPLLLTRKLVRNPKFLDNFLPHPKLERDLPKIITTFLFENPQRAFQQACATGLQNDPAILYLETLNNIYIIETINEYVMEQLKIHGSSLMFLPSDLPNDALSILISTTKYLPNAQILSTVAHRGLDAEPKCVMDSLHKITHSKSFHPARILMTIIEYKKRCKQLIIPEHSLINQALWNAFNHNTNAIPCNNKRILFFIDQVYDIYLFNIFVAVLTIAQIIKCSDLPHTVLQADLTNITTLYTTQQYEKICECAEDTEPAYNADPIRYALLTDDLYDVFIIVSDKPANSEWLTEYREKMNPAATIVSIAITPTQNQPNFIHCLDRRLAHQIATTCATISS